MLNVNCLKHPTMRRKIMKASYNVLKRGWSVDHVFNAKGQAIMAIRYDQVTKRFIVFDRNTKVITDIVAEAI